MRIIWPVRRGRKPRAAYPGYTQTKASFKSLGKKLLERGAQAIVAGCTEVLLVLSQTDLAVPLISSTDALVERVVVEAGAELMAG